MSCKREVIHQGEHLSKEVGVQGFTTLDANWACRVVVPDPAGGADLIDKAVTLKNADDSAFIPHLTPAETALLPVDDYVMAVELSNSTLTPAYNREAPVPFKVKQQLVN